MNIAELAIANGFVAPEGYNPLNGFFGCTTQHPYWELQKEGKIIEFCLNPFPENDPWEKAVTFEELREAYMQQKEQMFKSIRITEAGIVKYCGTEIPEWIESWLKS